MSLPAQNGVAQQYNYVDPQAAAGQAAGAAVANEQQPTGSGLGDQIAMSGLMPANGFNSSLSTAMQNYPSPGMSAYLNRGLGGAPATSSTGNGMPGAIRSPMASPQPNRIAGVQMR